MRAAEYYLKELLFVYDCVTIPGLGGFIMHSQPARIDREKSSIYPPLRYPSFNSLLSHDDGLLTSAIARTEQISYHDSGSFVRDFVTNLKRKLSVGEKIILEGIGEFSYGTEGTITFRYNKQVNFHAGVYGMEPLNIMQVTRLKPLVRNTQKHVDRKLQRSKDKQPASVRWTLLLSVPVVLFLLYGIIFPSSIQQLYTNYSGLVFDFGYPEGGIDARAGKDNSVMLNIEAVPAGPVLNSLLQAPLEKTLAPVAITNMSSPRYYIIGGCFLIAENADKFMHELISRGFEAEKAGSNNRGQIRISYKSFGDKTSALSYLQMIRNEENPSAWLLKY